MITDLSNFVNEFLGSSLMSPAYGWSGTRATINYNSPAAEKKIGRSPKANGQKEKGVWGK